MNTPSVAGVIVPGASDRPRGMGRGKVFPAEKAASLLNPLRRWVQSPRRTVAAMALVPGWRVLELGCGPGFFTPALVEVVGSGRVVALDLQWAMLSFGQTRGRQALAAQADALTLPFRSGSFDAVVIATVLGEVPDRDACVDELRRVTRSGGVACFAETRRDSDFIGFRALSTLVEAHRFRLLTRRGPGWQYVARFGAV